MTTQCVVREAEGPSTAVREVDFCEAKRRRERIKKPLLKALLSLSHSFLVTVPSSEGAKNIPIQLTDKPQFKWYIVGANCVRPEMNVDC